jgi:hypothetical protein
VFAFFNLINYFPNQSVWYLQIGSFRFQAQPIIFAIIIITYLLNLNAVHNFCFSLLHNAYTLHQKQNIAQQESIAYFVEKMKDDSSEKLLQIAFSTKHISEAIATANQILALQHNAN